MFEALRGSHLALKFRPDLVEKLIKPFAAIAGRDRAHAAMPSVHGHDRKECALRLIGYLVFEYRAIDKRCSIGQTGGIVLWMGMGRPGHCARIATR